MRSVNRFSILVACSLILVLSSPAFAHTFKFEDPQHKYGKGALAIEIHYQSRPMIIPHTTLFVLGGSQITYDEDNDGPIRVRIEPNSPYVCWERDCPPPNVFVTDLSQGQNVTCSIDENAGNKLNCHIT